MQLLGRYYIMYRMCVHACACMYVCPEIHACIRNWIRKLVRRMYCIMHRMCCIPSLVKGIYYRSYSSRTDYIEVTHATWRTTPFH